LDARTARDIAAQKSKQEILEKVRIWRGEVQVDRSVAKLGLFWMADFWKDSKLFSFSVCFWTLAWLFAEMHMVIRKLW